MKKKSDKQKDLDALKKDFEKAQNIFVTGFEKLTVQQDFELRKTIRGAGGNYEARIRAMASGPDRQTYARGRVGARCNWWHNCSQRDSPQRG